MFTLDHNMVHLTFFLCNLEFLQMTWTCTKSAQFKWGSNRVWREVKATSGNVSSFTLNILGSVQVIGFQKWICVVSKCHICVESYMSWQNHLYIKWGRRDCKIDPCRTIFDLLFSLRRGTRYLYVFCLPYRTYNFCTSWVLLSETVMLKLAFI